MPAEDDLMPYALSYVPVVVGQYVRVELRNADQYQGVLYHIETNSHRKLTHLTFVPVKEDGLRDYMNSVRVNVSDRRRRVTKLWVLEED